MKSETITEFSQYEDVFWQPRDVFELFNIFHN